MTENELRKDVVSNVNGWVGGRQGGAIHKEILKIWNDYAAKHGLPHAYESYAWCAETASAAYIKAGIGPYVPLSLSCGQLIEQAKAKGWWIENDAHKPKIADQVIYGWDAPKTGDAPGKYYHDHVGTVVSVGKDTFTVVEGNAGSPSQVKKLTRDVDFRYISGFICPDFKALAKKLTPKESTQKPVASKPVETKPTTSKTSENKKAQEFTASIKGNYRVIALDGLNLRTGPGTSYKIILAMHPGDTVTCYGYHTKDWYYVQYVSGKTTYEGFCVKTYLRKK